MSRKDARSLDYGSYIYFLLPTTRVFSDVPTVDQLSCRKSQTLFAQITQTLGEIKKQFLRFGGEVGGAVGGAALPKQTVKLTWALKST